MLIADDEGCKEVMALGDGWHAVYRPQASSSTPRVHPDSLKKRADSYDIPPRETSLDVSGSRQRSQTDRGAGWAQAAMDAAQSHEEMLRAKALESLQRAEAQHALAMAEGSPTFESVRARYAPTGHHVAAPVKTCVSLKRADSGDLQCPVSQEPEDMLQCLDDFQFDEEILYPEHQHHDMQNKENSSPQEIAAAMAAQSRLADERRLRWKTRPGENMGQDTSPTGRAVPMSDPAWRMRHDGRGGECCVGNTGWTQMLTWMGLLSLDIG